MQFSEIIHLNRDENSFTARLFNSLLLPEFRRNADAFHNFIKRINESSEKNIIAINEKLGTKLQPSSVPENLCFSDAMLFLECLDVYPHYMGELNEIPDKTEFDAIVVAEDADKNEFIIAFEVKCYTNLIPDEIDRQNKHLRHFRQQGAFQDFAQVLLISYANLINARTSFKHGFFETVDEPILIVTWEDLRGYLKEPFFYLDRDCYLPKSISKQGKKSSMRELVKRDA